MRPESLNWLCKAFPIRNAQALEVLRELNSSFESAVEPYGILKLFSSRELGLHDRVWTADAPGNRLRDEADDDGGGTTAYSNRIRKLTLP